MDKIDKALKDESPKTLREVFQQLRETVWMCWKLAHKYRLELILAYTTTVLIEALGLAVPWLISLLTARIAGHPLDFDWKSIPFIFGGVWLSWFSWLAIDILRDQLGYIITRGLERDLPYESLKRFLTLSRAFHQANNTPELASKVTRGAAYVKDIINLTQFNILPLLTLILGTLVFLSLMHWGFALLATSILVIYFWLMLRGRLKSRPHFDTRYETERLADRLFGEAAANALTVQAFHREEGILNAYQELRTKMHECQKAEGRIGLRSWATRNFVSDQVQLSMMFLALVLVHHSRLSVSTFIFVIALIDRYRNQLFNFGWMYDQFMEKTNGIRRLYFVLQQKTTITDPEHPKELPIARCADVVFDDVSFRYDSEEPNTAEVWALEHVNLSVAAGEVLGIAGKSGQGKSTLISLLLRYADPSLGDIRMNGVSLREVTLGALRTRIGYVEQEVRLFNDTIANNIRFGRTCTQEELEAATIVAGAHEFISGLPKGYETIIGDRGMKLSGGQRQRLGIARAILGKPSLLIFDEATSSIDAESIELIMQALERIKGSCTIILVSHQLSTLQRLADRIAIVRNGQIDEIGTHEQLMQENGLYRHLVEIQQSCARQEA